MPSKISTTSTSTTPEPAATIRVMKRQRPTDWICGFGGAKLPFTPDALAHAIVKTWYPETPAQVAPSTPGWSGMSAYSVRLADKKLHMKVMIPGVVDGVRAPIAEVAKRESIMKEAHRAAWAGRHGLGPSVVAYDADRGAYACDFIDGILPTVEQSKGKFLVPYLATFAKLHWAPTTDLPALTGGRNWLYDIDSAACLAQADAPRPTTRQHELLQLERQLEHYLAKTFFHKQPVHGDLKLDNTLVTQKGVMLIDWGNLHLDDAMTDLGCFFAMADVPMRSLETMLKLYDAQTPHVSELKHEDPSRLGRLQANTALLRLKNVTFYDQWDGSRGKAEYLYETLKEDLPGLNASILREIGA